MSDIAPEQPSKYADRLGLLISPNRWMELSHDPLYRFVRDTLVRVGTKELARVVTIWWGHDSVPQAEPVPDPDNPDDIALPTMFETTVFAKLDVPSTVIGVDLDGDGGYWAQFPAFEPVVFEFEADAMTEHSLIVHRVVRHFADKRGYRNVRRYEL